MRNSIHPIPMIIVTIRMCKYSLSFLFIVLPISLKLWPIRPPNSSVSTSLIAFILAFIGRSIIKSLFLSSLQLIIINIFKFYSAIFFPWLQVINFVPVWLLLKMVVHVLIYFYLFFERWSLEWVANLWLVSLICFQVCSVSEVVISVF